MSVVKHPKTREVQQQQIRTYFREVSERCKLPPMPAIVTSSLRLARDPNVSMAKLSRVLSNDAALAARLLTVARSAFYGRRTAPRTLEEAIHIVGLRTVQRILVTSAAYTLCGDYSPCAASLWDHSLAVALTAELFARQHGLREIETAFLTGLLHDVGQMVLLHGDGAGFQALAAQVKAQHLLLLPLERHTYGSDHTLIGLVLMDCWEFESNVGKAIRHHHDAMSAVQELDSLTALLVVSEYVAGLAGFRFLPDPVPPPPEMLAWWGCGDEDALWAMTEQIDAAMRAEKALYT